MASGSLKATESTIGTGLHLLSAIRHSSFVIRPFSFARFAEIRCNLVLRSTLLMLSATEARIGCRFGRLISKVSPHVASSTHALR